MGICCTSTSPNGYIEKAHSLSITCKSYSDCGHVIRLKMVLNHYGRWTSSESKKPTNGDDGDDGDDGNQIGILEYMNNKNSENDNKHDENNVYQAHSIVSILQDYHHLISHHSSEFEEVYNYFCDIDICTMSSCGMIGRNHRDRSSNTSNRNDRKLYHQNKDNYQVIIQQILDQIHCYIYHTFDMGFKLRKEDLEEEDIDLEENLIINNRLERIGKVMRRKKKQIRELRNRALLDNADNADNADNNKFQSNESNDVMFSFGVRYYYDAGKYKDNDELDVEFNINNDYNYKYSDWFIEEKYKNLKKELLNNKLCVIDRQQWDELYAKAKHYLETEYICSHCPHLKKKHLVAVMIYCNFDKLQSEFSKTYRGMKDMKDMKARHSEFVHLGKILRDAVELNGTKVDVGKTKTFFHGIDVELMFTSTLHKFIGPISTSSQHEVALVFTKDNGIILELNDGTLLSKEQNAMYFDCEFISDFGYEKEKLFMGGQVPLKIVAIFHVRENQNYGEYIRLITILLAILKGDIALNIHAKDERAIVRLLKHELNDPKLAAIPTYITRLLHHICLDVERFTTRYKVTFASKTSYTVLSKFLCYSDSDCELFKLELLCKLFPNLTSITIDCSSLTEKVFENILQFVNTHYPDKKNIKKNDADDYDINDINDINDIIDIDQLLVGKNENKNENENDNDKEIKEMKLNNIVFKSPVSPISFENIQRQYHERFDKKDWAINYGKRYLIVQRNKQTRHNHDSSRNLLITDLTFHKTEQFVLANTLIFV